MPTLTATQLAEWSQTKQPALYGTVIPLMILGNVALFMRLWAQFRVHKKAFAEDYFLIAALVFSNVISLATLVGTHYGLGHHIWRIEAEDPSMKNLVAVFVTFWLEAIFTAPALLCIKLGLLFFYRRLFLINQLWLKVAWWTNLVYAVLWAIGSFFFYVFQCLPANYYWERMNPQEDIVGGHCTSGTVLVGVPLMLSVVSDFAILLLPIAVVARLSLDRYRKLGLLALFSVGLIACCCGLARVLVLELDTENSSDATWGTVNFDIFNVVECNLGIVCASIVPVVSLSRDLFARYQTRRSEPSFESGSAGRTFMMASRSGFPDNNNRTRNESVISGSVVSGSWKKNSSSEENLRYSADATQGTPRDDSSEDGYYGGIDSNIHVTKGVFVSSV